MKDLAEQTWSADIGGDELHDGTTQILVTDEDGRAVAAVYGKTYEEAEQRAKAIAMVPLLMELGYNSLNGEAS